MTSDNSLGNRTVVYAHPPGSDNFIAAKIPIEVLNEEIMDAAFTKAVGCTQYPGSFSALNYNCLDASIQVDARQ